MKCRSLIVGVVVFLGIQPAIGADWKPANGPLLTRWAKDVSADNALPEYPRPQLVRKDWLNLNGIWQLAIAQEGEAAPVGKELAERILVPFPVESALSGVMKSAERLWYHRTFSVPEPWTGRRLLLHFGAVDWEATVWLNGKKLGSHRGGFDGFSFDITDALNPKGNQELVVGVWDPTDAGTQPRGKQVRKPGGIFYTSATGIWQTVWLEPVPDANIADLKIVPDVDAGNVHVTVLGNGTTGEDKVKLTARAEGQNVASAEGKVGQAIDLPIEHPRLWSTESPFLYDLHVELERGGKTADKVQSYFGMRKISIGQDNGITRILLNNKFVFQVGPLDQGFWPDGIYTAPTDEALKFDIETIKKLGFNMARKHVKVEPERWYYWCDKLGLLVWQDMPAGDNLNGKGKLPEQANPAGEFERELKAMIDGRHNHPSIILWVLFNEGWGQYDTVRLTKWIKAYDPSRLVDNASGWTDSKIGDIHDMHNYPGPGSPDPEPNRAAVLGEFGGLGLTVDGHLWAHKTWGYRGAHDREDLTRQYERLLARAWQLKDKPGLCAAVYTQLTDVETEGNGLLTYDRAVIKVDAERVAAVNRGDVAHIPVYHEVVSTSRQKGVNWHYTLENPPADWFAPGLDDSGWKEGPGGFGTRGTPGAVVRTEWKTADIWLRRHFTLPEGAVNHPAFSLHHDEDAEIYLNGVLAAKVADYTTEYEEISISAEARATLKPGDNLIAVHCHQTTGGQYLDVGLLDLKEQRP